MKTTLGLAGLLFCSIYLSFAQSWMPVAGTPNEGWDALASSADGTKLFAGSSDWTFWLSTNSGASWTTNSRPQDNSYYGPSHAIASSADGNTVAAVGGNSGSVIWASTNGALTWFSNNVAGVNFLGSITLSADGKILAVAAGFHSPGYSPGPIFISTNSGLTVTPTSAPTNNWAALASSANGTRLVAATITSSASGLIYTSTNSGLTWAPTTAPTNNAWMSVASSADGVKLIAASAVCVYTSTNGGTTWISNNLPDVQWISAASSADGTKLAVVSVANIGLIYTSTNSGATWTSNSVPTGGWAAVASSADGNQLLAAPNYPAGPLFISRTLPAPRLCLTPSAANFTLSWAIPSTPFALQQTTNLAAGWSALTNQPALNLTNLENQVALPALPGDNAFYRLIHL
jgi:hypothetical protein